MSPLHRDTRVSYDDRLAEVASWYRDHADPARGGWPMRWGETREATDRPSLIGTAYGLAVLRYARTPVTDDHVQAALRFALDPGRTWTSTRHPVYTIHAATEWPETLAEDGMGPGALVTPEHVHARIAAALDWLAANRTDDGWPSSSFPDGHRCLAWTAKVLYTFGRLRQRGDPYRADETITDQIRSAADLLLELRHRLDDGSTSGAWPFCGDNNNSPSIATTALIVIALSHRDVESAGTPEQQERWREAYRAGANWLLEQHGLWEDNEHGEHDPETDDDWQFAIWSLAPRACLSAGVSPNNPHLARGIDFAFNRWRSGKRPGWYILGKGVSGYSNWSVVQLGQVLKLAISRLDPVHVLRALQTGPTALEMASDITILLDNSTRTAQLIRANGTRAAMPLARQEKRFKLLQAFAARDVPNGAMLDFETLNSWVNDTNGKQIQNPWEAMKALAHQINEAARELLKDPSVQVMHATARKRKQRGIIINARCRFKTPETDLKTVALEDVTGISAATGEAY